MRTRLKNSPVPDIRADWRPISSAWAGMGLATVGIPLQVFEENQS